MRLPIQYAMSYPDRIENSIPRLDLTQIGKFHFFHPDIKRFPCLEFGYQAKRTGGTMPAVLNAANEVAVQHFLGGSVPFVAIPRVIERVMTRHRPEKNPSLDQILAADEWAREHAEVLCRR